MLPGRAQIPDEILARFTAVSLRVLSWNTGMACGTDVQVLVLSVHCLLLLRFAGRGEQETR